MTTATKRKETRKESEYRRALQELVTHVKNEKRIHPFSLNVRASLDRAERILP